MHNGHMRTTIEIRPEHRSALLALASRRGHKGFSAVLAEAIESFLKDEAERETAASIVVTCWFAFEGGRRRITAHDKGTARESAVIVADTDQLA